MDSYDCIDDRNILNQSWNYFSSIRCTEEVKVGERKVLIFASVKIFDGRDVSKN